MKPVIQSVIATLLLFLLPSAGLCVSHLIQPDGSGDYPTIQAGGNAAAPGDTLLLANGIFRGPGNRDIDFGGKPLVVASLNNQPENVVIDCEGSLSSPHRAFRYVSGETAASRLVGFTIENGFSTDAGGGVYCDASSPSFDGIIFRSNTAARGGGLCALNPPDTLRATHCTFVSNIASGTFPTSGGGVYVLSGVCRFERVQIDSNEAVGSFALGGGLHITSDLIMRNSWIRWNEADYYGGMFLNNPGVSEIRNTHILDNFAQSGGGGIGRDGMGPTRFAGCTFERNVSLLGGGGLVLSGENSTVDSCTFSRNRTIASTGSGAGILMPSAATTALVNHSLFYENTADSGAAVYMTGSNDTVDFNNCTFVANSAKDGAIVQMLVPASVTTIRNCLFAFNPAGCAVNADTIGTLVFTCNDVYGNQGDYVCAITGQEGSNGNFSLDPYFCDPGERDYTLAAISPCLSASGCGPVGALGQGCSSPFPNPVGVETNPDQSLPDVRLVVSPLPVLGSSGGTTRIDYSLGTAGRKALLEVFDVAGRRHGSIVLRGRTGVLSWSEVVTGGGTSPGVFFLRLTGNGDVITRKVIIVD